MVMMTIVMIVMTTVMTVLRLVATLCADDGTPSTRHGKVRPCTCEDVGVWDSKGLVLRCQGSELQYWQGGGFRPAWEQD